MYQEEIKDILKQKREALYYITKDILYLYIELFLFRRNNIKERKQLIKMLKNYWREQQDEKEVLKLIATYFSFVDIDDDIEAILDELDFIFERQYLFYDYYLGKYESFIEGDLLSVNFPFENVPEIESKEELKKYILNLSKES